MRRRDLIKLAGAAALGYFANAFGQDMPGVRLRKLNCHWEARKKSKWLCDLSTTEKAPYDFTELYANGKRQIRARFPDMHPDGTDAYITAVGILPANAIRPDLEETDGQDVFALIFDPATLTHHRWAKPEEAILHVYRGGSRSDLQLQLKAIDYDRNLLWCAKGNLKDPSELGSTIKFYVENLAEDISMPGEWYLNQQTGTVTYLPADDLDMTTAVFEVPV